jgi:O-antigen ligase/tetratricopeptide (TPR) repeat protein
VRFIDTVVGGALVLIVLFTALAFGSVYSWAFKTMEVAIFAIFAVWMMSFRAGGEMRAILPFAAPIAVFLAFCLLQLVPIAPAVMGAISPRTLSLYERVMPGWPVRAPFAKTPFVDEASAKLAPEIYVLPTPAEVRGGAPIPFASPSPEAPRPPRRVDVTWLAERDRMPRYGTSIAPALGRTALFKACAYAALFVLVIGYARSDRNRERRVSSLVFTGLVGAGILIAALGVINRLSWNGRVLWILTPADWTSVPAMVRASGPFVNPDDFANYMALLMPIAIAGAMQGIPFRRRDGLAAFRVASGAGALVMAAAIVLSLSRAGWASAAVGVASFFLLISLPAPGGSQAPLHPRWRRWVRAASVAVIAAIVVAAVIAIGASIIGHRDAGAVSAGAGAAELGMEGRVALWRGTLAMIHDFPILGVGLGGWPAVFPRYRLPPWFPLVYREAHNDYLQFTAEAGIVGVALLVWIFARIMLRLCRAIRARTDDWPFFAALVAAVPAMATHEMFDFCLHIPANAVLFTLILALAIRWSSETDAVAAQGALPRWWRAGRFAAPIIAIVLAIATLADPARGYPYDIQPPHFASDAIAQTLTHPARSEAHLSLAQFIADSAPEARLAQFDIAAWLDPVNPATRDRYAQALLADGKTAQALRQIGLSVFNAPAGSEHFYLSERVAPFLTDQAAAAIEAGYRRALAAGIQGSLWGLSDFYAAQGRYQDQARLLASYLELHPELEPGLPMLMTVGTAYLKAGNRLEAERTFRSAISRYPDQPAPYDELIRDLYGPEGNVDAALAVVQQAVSNGLDGTPLRLLTLNIAQASGNKAAVENIMRTMLADHPSPDLLLKLGGFCLDNNQPDRAVALFRRAISANPASAGAYFLLGRAEEAGYHYSAADNAYSRAISLAPDNAEYRLVYRSFREKIKRDSAAQ